ncbi:MAG: hypothetical protein AB8B53_07980 [Flavobacteriales bacterium]
MDTTNDSGLSACNSLNLSLGYRGHLEFKSRKLTETEKIVKQLIPPQTYECRNGFSNKHLVEKLTTYEKIEVENLLLSYLHDANDLLIGETLALLNSKKSLPLLRMRLDRSQSPSERIIWARFINQIVGRDEEMKKVVLNEFRKVTDKYALISVFYDLASFNDDEIDGLILKFVDNKEYLLAYNAKRSLQIR